jgi:phage terminase small subunit
VVNIDKDIRISNKAPAGDPRKLDPEDIKALMAERKGLINQTAHYRVDLNSISSNDLPHVYILYGPPGVGKSIWAHALASLLKLNIRSVDIGAQKDMWLGNTEKNCIRLFNTMKDSRDTVYLIDEIDRQVEMGSSQGPSTHKTTKEIVSRFLDLFDNTENERKFRQNNVFFIMTTNNVEEIDTALLQRVSETYEVQLPDRPEDYEKFFRSYLNVERGRFPDDPWFCDEEDKTNEECWTSTMEMLNSMDWKRISVVFAQKKIDFRSLKKMLQQAFNEHRTWRIRSRMIGKGKIIEPRGLPLTTQNIVDVGNIISTASDSNDSFKLGVGQLASERAEQARKMLEPYTTGQKKLETISVTDPHTGKTETRFKLPDDVMKVMTGEAQAEKEKETPQGDWEYKREIDPETGQVKTELKPKAPKVDPLKEMQELQDKGFKEEPLVELPQEKQPPAKVKGKEIKNKENMKAKDKIKEEEPVTSSTDYFFDYLGKKGLIDDNKFVVPVKKATVEKVEMEKTAAVPKQDVQKIDDSGVYNYGFIMIAPGAGKVPSQQIKTELSKGNK